MSHPTPTIDWSIFDEYPESTVECGCGATYRSHTRTWFAADRRLQIHSRKPCPSCFASIDNARRVRSDPEIYRIEGAK